MSRACAAGVKECQPRVKCVEVAGYMGRETMLQLARGAAGVVGRGGRCSRRGTTEEAVAFPQQSAIVSEPLLFN